MTKKSPAEAAREAMKTMTLWDIAGSIGTFANDPPDSEFQLIYLRTLAREFYNYIATWKLGDPI